MAELADGNMTRPQGQDSHPHPSTNLIQRCLNLVRIHEMVMLSRETPIDQST